MGSIRAGWRWIDGRFKFRKCWEKEDRKGGDCREQRTACEMKKVMDFSNLKFELETPMMFENGRLPTLDFEFGCLTERFYTPFIRNKLQEKHSSKDTLSDLVVSQSDFVS